jgi:hypothetical protein
MPVSGRLPAALRDTAALSLKLFKMKKYLKTKL